MRVLVTFGSKRGGTAGLAEAVGEGLRQAGQQVDVRPAHEIEGLTGWDAVVVGGALYAGRWQRDAARFIERHVDELREMPVWLFSSGPLDDTAAREDIAPTGQVKRLLARVGGRGHITFGGRLAPDAKGFIAHAMVKNGKGGDFRDLDAARAWGHAVADSLPASIGQRQPSPVGGGPLAPLVRKVVGWLCLLVGLTAVWGGVELMVWPSGPPPLAMHPSMLRHSPFSDFFFPGLLLAVVVGLGNLIAGILMLRRHLAAAPLAGVAGGAITVWILTELAMIRMWSWLQGTYLAAGLVTMAGAIAVFYWRRAAVRSHRPDTASLPLRPSIRAAVS